MEAGTVPDAPPENMEVVVEGTSAQLTLDIGGDKEPTRSTITITGGKFNVSGQFEMLERLSLVILDPDGNQVAKAPLVIDDVGGKAFIDGKTGDVTDVERRHRARVQK